MPLDEKHRTVFWLVLDVVGGDDHALVDGLGLEGEDNGAVLASLGTRAVLIREGGKCQLG